MDHDQVRVHYHSIERIGGCCVRRSDHPRAGRPRSDDDNYPAAPAAWPQVPPL